MRRRLSSLCVRHRYSPVDGIRLTFQHSLSIRTFAGRLRPSFRELNMMLYFVDKRPVQIFFRLRQPFTPRQQPPLFIKQFIKHFFAINANFAVVRSGAPITATLAQINDYLFFKLRITSPQTCRVKHTSQRDFFAVGMSQHLKTD